MTIPSDILAVVITLAATIVVGLQAWILIEIVSLKVRLSNYENLSEKVERHGDRLLAVEAHCGIETAK